MVLNLTKKPFERFSASQRLALQGEPLTTVVVRDIEEFGAVYDNYSKVKMIIVEPDQYVLNNDIINYVDSKCRVVTLSIEILVEPENIMFLPLEYEK